MKKIIIVLFAFTSLLSCDLLYQLFGRSYSNNFLFEFGNSDFNIPRYLTIDHLGNVYVGDTENYNIKKYDAAGNYIKTYQHPQSEQSMGGITYYSNALYIVNWTTDTIEKLDLLSELYTTNFIVNREILDMEYPINLEVYDNKIFVANRNDCTVEIFDLQGNHLQSWNNINKNLGLNGPVDIECYKDKVYILQHFGHEVIVANMSGNYIETIAGSYLDMPYGIEVEDDLIFVSELLRHRISVFNITGAFQGHFGESGSGQGEFNRPVGMEIMAGKIYILDQMNSRVHVFDYY